MKCKIQGHARIVDVVTGKEADKIRPRHYATRAGRNRSFFRRGVRTKPIRNTPAMSLGELRNTLLAIFGMR